MGGLRPCLFCLFRGVQNLGKPAYIILARSLKVYHSHEGLTNIVHTGKTKSKTSYVLDVLMDIYIANSITNILCP